VAVDAETSMLELSRSRVPAVELRHVVLPHLPLTDDSFDAAVAKGAQINNP